jgi:hypothetical protein
VAAAAALAFSGVAAPRAARAWDDFGHMEVAAVAFGSLTPKVKKRVAALLALNPRYPNWIVGAPAAERERAAFMRAATWADAIRTDPAFDHDPQHDPPGAPTATQNVGYGDTLPHTYWHYVNRPLSADGTPVPPTPVPNVETEIRLLRAALAAETTPDALKSYDLVWLLHLVGDVHMPLHCVARFDAREPSGDRGGNNVQITGNAQPPTCDDPRYCPYGPPTELHAFLDTIAGSGYATAPVLAAAAKLPKAPAPAAAEQDVSAWVTEGFDLARAKVYVPPIGLGPGPFEVTPAYQAAMAELGRKRIALAGARLARLLNDALGR